MLKKFLITILAIFISVPLSFALTYTSPNYSLLNPRIVVSGGSAASANYTINNVAVGSFYGGKAASANYTLDASSQSNSAPPSPPTLNPVTSPTNIQTQILTGTKHPGTSIYVNGYEEIPLNGDSTWSYTAGLSEGENYFFIQTKNSSDLISTPVHVTIALDITPPYIVIEAPLDGTIVYTSQLDVEGTIDGVNFTETRDLTFGKNPIAIEATDEAGNTSVKGIEIYLVREPVELP